MNDSTTTAPRTSVPAAQVAPAPKRCWSPATVGAGAFLLLAPSVLAAASAPALALPTWATGALLVLALAVGIGIGAVPTRTPPGEAPADSPPDETDSTADPRDPSVGPDVG